MDRYKVIDLIWEFSKFPYLDLPQFTLIYFNLPQTLISRCLTWSEKAPLAEFSGGCTGKRVQASLSSWYPRLATLSESLFDTYLLVPSRLPTGSEYRLTCTINTFSCPPGWSQWTRAALTEVGMQDPEGTRPSQHCQDDRRLWDGQWGDCARSLIPDFQCGRVSSGGQKCLVIIAKYIQVISVAEYVPGELFRLFDQYRQEVGGARRSWDNSWLQSK